MSLAETPPYSGARLKAAIGKTVLKAALGIAVATGVLGAGQAQALVVNVNGQNWNVTTFTGTYNANSSKFETPANGGAMPWFTSPTGSSSLAVSFATAVGNSLGFPSTNSGDGPFFGWRLGPSVNQVSFVATTTDGYTGPIGATGMAQNRTWAQATLVPAPVPGPLPALGAAAAFGFSRKLRQRIKATANSVSKTYSL